ncbi:VOC family protein [Nocardiopsis oceani]
MSLHHLAVTSHVPTEAARFYDAVLPILGYTRAAGEAEPRVWHGPSPEILLYGVEGPDRSSHTHGRPGWHHAAFRTADRDRVEAVHKAVCSGGWTVVHPPRAYPEYTEGYYAVFVEAPGGQRLEFAHIP